mgnify:CR=1 FL=1
MKNLETIINYQEEQREFWKNVWASVSSSNNCSNKEVPTRWADKALQDFNDRFQKNVDYIKSLKDSVEIIFTTSRPEKYRNITQKQLLDLGIEYKQLIMGLQSNQRIIVNDYSSTNSYPNCSAINLKRNSEELGDLLSNII